MEASVATELRLGLPGSEAKMMMSSNKRSCSEMNDSCQHQIQEQKAQVVGWPPVRNILQKKAKSDSSAMFVKVSMDGAPYLRKIYLKFYMNYLDLLMSFENMFKCSIGVYSEREGEFAATYEDKDGDWMLVGDVPWEMFVTSCIRLRIMKASEARGLGCL